MAFSEYMNFKKLNTNLFHRKSKYLDPKETKYYKTNRWNDETTEILHTGEIKGHLISEQICEDIDFPKLQRKYY